MSNLLKQSGSSDGSFTFIPSVSDDEQNLTATAQFMKTELPGVGIEILPYHELGKSKYSALGMQKQFYSYRVPTAEEVETAYRYFDRLDIKRVSLDS